MTADAKTYERRNADRIAVFVPLTLRCGEEKYTGRLINIARGGALIATSAPLTLHSRIELVCGTIVASAFVIWGNDDGYGVKFARPIAGAQLQEQVSRTLAMEAMAAIHFKRLRRSDRPV